MNYKLFILSFFISLLTWGQERQTLNEIDFINKVKSENIQVKRSIQEINQAKAEYLQSNALFLPNITASHSAMLTTNPLMAFGSKLNQGILTQNDFNPSLLNNPVATRNFATILQIEQPLLNADGLYQRKAAKEALEATKLQVTRKNDYLIIESKKAYMQLQLTYQGLEVMQKASELLNRLKKQTQDFYSEGLVQKSDVLAIEIRVLEIENSIKTTKSHIVNISNYLSFLMNSKTEVIYQPNNDIQVSNPEMNLANTLPMSRADIRAMEHATNSRKNMLQSDKLSYLPRLNAFGSYELYDNQIFQGGANGYIIGAQLKWDIFKGSKRIGKIQKSKAAFEASKLALDEYKMQSELELRKTQRLLSDAKRSLQFSKLGVEQSEEVLRIKTNRFNEGLEKITNVLEAETKVSERRLAYYHAIYQHNTLHNYLEFLTKEN
ncbi:MAG: transporter [Flavobacteriaceae bacterium]|nr:transporter [Flavobacteriaceae bacterium]|tara:strand:- start:91545 stop:92852 length:1308 start_codon:yes stop_codon:yes gene_type:complete